MFEVISRIFNRIFPRATAEIVFYHGRTDHIRTIRSCYFVTASIIRPAAGEFAGIFPRDRVTINRYYGQSNIQVKSVSPHEIKLDFEADLTAIALQEKHCQGCKYFHGQFYGNKYLHCAVHPYGLDNVLECEDYEAK